MIAEELRIEIDRLGLSEKLILVEDIWDSIAAAKAVPPLSDWQKIELKRREREYRQGEMELYDWQAVHEELRGRY